LLGGRPPGFPAIGLLNGGIRRIRWVLMTTGNALKVGSDNLPDIGRYNTRRLEVIIHFMWWIS